MMILRSACDKDFLAFVGIIIIIIIDVDDNPVRTMTIMVKVGDDLSSQSIDYLGSGENISGS